MNAWNVTSITPTPYGVALSGAVRTFCGTSRRSCAVLVKVQGLWAWRRVAGRVHFRQQPFVTLTLTARRCIAILNTCRACHSYQMMVPCGRNMFYVWRYKRAVKSVLTDTTHNTNLRIFSTFTFCCVRVWIRRPLVITVLSLPPAFCGPQI